MILIGLNLLDINLQGMITVNILRIIFNINKSSIYYGKYLKYIGQSIFNNDLLFTHVIYAENVSILPCTKNVPILHEV